jgi:ribonuclease Z
VKITFLGTSTVVPAAGHETACAIVNGRYLIDTGWNAAIGMKSDGYDPMLLDAVFLTHCHHDHYIGLPHLFFHMCMRASERPDRPPLKVIGPEEDVQRVVDLSLALLQPERFDAVAYAPDVIPMAPGDTYSDDAVHVTTCRTVHPVASLCYRFTDTQSGASLAYTGDTAYHAPIAEHAAGVGLLVTEASYGGSAAPADNASLHSGAPEAARLANAAGAERLALVHCPEEKQNDAVVAARRDFRNSFIPEDGETVELAG